MTNLKTTEKMTSTIWFYEGHYQYNEIKTDLNVSPDFIEMKLAKQYEYRPTERTLWATVQRNGIEVARYEFKYGVGLI